MYGFFEFCLEVVFGVLDLRGKRRALIVREADVLCKEHGQAAFETAQRVASLAKQRGDGRSTDLWLAVAQKIASRENAKQR